jgi:hypothetical protein
MSYQGEYFINKQQQNERLILEQVKAHFKEEIEESGYCISKKDLIELWTVGPEITRAIEDFRKMGTWVKEKPKDDFKKDIKNSESKGTHQITFILEERVIT